MDWVHVGIESADPVEHGLNRLTPRSLVAWLRIPWPGGGAAIIYNRPIAVRVQAGDAPARTIPIINFNRLAQIMIFINASVLAGILASLIWRSKK